MQRQTMSRRIFLAGTAVTMAGLAAKAHAKRVSPNEKLNIAGIGIGGRGRSDIEGCKSENIVALCDVDEKYAEKTFSLYPNAKRYKDYRVMLEKEKDIDAVVIATPDHTHAIVAMAAMKMGKHVYCEKPLTHTIQEARKLTETAREMKVATQMGTQGHSFEGIRQICEWIWAGVIGPVREVHIWTNRPLGVWPQGIGRPEGSSPVPANLDWDLWIGPAPFRPYVEKVYHPFVWRGWWDFGCGSLGDMGCHLIDAPTWALDLKYPISVEARSTALTPRTDETGPLASIVYYDFPARGDKPPVRLTWWDGGMVPPRPAELPDGEPLGNRNGGVIFVGDKGKIIASDENAQKPKILPDSLAKDVGEVPKTIPRSIGHFKEWIAACKGGQPAGANFDYAGPLTEVILLGNMAIRMGNMGEPQPTKKLLWDGPNMKCTNVEEANQLVSIEYRQGWSL